MIDQQEFNLILQKGRNLPPAQGMYLVYDYIENLFITVLDFMMQGCTIKKAMAYY